MKLSSELKALPAFYSSNLTFGYGEQGAGKTSLFLQIGSQLAKQMKKKVLYIRTEKGDFEEPTKELCQKFGAEVIYERIKPFTRKEIESENDAILYNIFEFFGEKIILDHSEKGNVRFHILENKMITKENDGKKYRYREIPNACEAIIRNENVGVLVIDSFSEPLKVVFPGGDNLANRANALNAWAFAILRLVEKHDLFCFVIHHTQGEAPDANHSAKRAMFAQDSMGFKAEYSFLLTMMKGKETQNFVRVTTVRYPGLTEWAHESWLYLAEGIGFRDILPEELVKFEK